MLKSFLTLTPENLDKNNPSKLIYEDGTITSYKSGLMFYFFENAYTVETFHEVIGNVLEDKSSFMILGKLNEFGESQIEIEAAMSRRKKDKGDGIPASIEIENESDIMVLDLDDHYVKGWNPLDPEPTLKEWLKEKEIDCDVTWQITSSQKLDSELMRVRLYFLTDGDFTLEARKAYATYTDIGADGSVFSSNQPIYTTPPTFESGMDFIPVRHGFIAGNRKTLKIPKLSEKEVKKKIRESGVFTDYDFTGELPEEVLSGKVYRRYFMPYAFSLCNKGLSREDICDLIELKTTKTPREFDRENVMQYIDDAFARIALEEANKTVGAEVFEKEEILAIIENTKLGDCPYTKHEWPSGFLGKFAREIYERMNWPNKEIAILTARVVVAAIQGRRFSFKGLNLNQNNVLLGAQAIGKETVNWTLNKVLSQLAAYRPGKAAHIMAYAAGVSPKGIKALHRIMSKSPSTLIIIPEAGSASKSESGDMHAVKGYTLSNFAVGAHSAFAVNDYSARLPQVFGTNFVRLEESEINSYAHNFTSDMATSGEFARKNHHFIDPKPDDKTILGKVDFSEEIIQGLWQIIKFGMKGEKFDTVEKTGKEEWKGPTLKPCEDEFRVEISVSVEAQRLMNIDLEREHEIRVSGLDTNSRSWARMARLYEKTLREAILYCSVEYALNGKESETPILTDEHYLEAKAYIEECDRSTSENSHLFKNNTQQLIDAILKFGLNMKEDKHYLKYTNQKLVDLKMVSHSTIFTGNKKENRLADRLAENDPNTNMTKARMIEEAYQEGERIGYWDIIDGKAYNAVEVYSQLGIRRDRKRYLKFNIEG